MPSNSLRSMLVGATALVASATAGLAQTVRYGGWDVGPSYSDQTGRFDYCLMNSSYQDRTEVGVLMTAEGGWGLLFSHPNWNLRDGQRITATVTVDGTTIARGEARIMGYKLILLPLSGDHAFSSLQAGNGMRVTTSIGRIGNELPFSLRGTRMAMDAVVNCVRDYRDTSRAPRRPSGPPETAGGGGGGGAGRQVPVPAAEARAMVNSMLAQAGISGHQFDPPRDNTVTWLMPDGTRGAFFAFRNWTAPIEQALSSVTEAARNDCRGGDLGTIERSVPTSDGSLVRKISVACRQGSNTSNSTWTLVRRLDGLLMAFTHSGNDGEGDGSRSRQHDDRVLQGVLRM